MSHTSNGLASLPQVSPRTAQRLSDRLTQIEELLGQTATKSDVRRIERRIDKAEQNIIGAIHAQGNR